MFLEAKLEMFSVTHDAGTIEQETKQERYQQGRKNCWKK